MTTPWLFARVAIPALLAGGMMSFAGDEPLTAPAAATILPLSGNHVTFRDDQTFLVNGKPFFPIGLYYAANEIADPTGQQLATLHEMGFNFIQYYGVPVIEELDRIAKAGLYVKYTPPGSLYKQLDGLEKLVSQVRFHPAILSWEVSDEPIFNKISFEATKQGCELMRKLDPDHPIMVVHAIEPPHFTNNDLVKWSVIVDINGFDFYPVPMSRIENWGVCLLGRVNTN